MRMPSVIEGIRYVSEGYPLSLMRFQVVNDRDGSFRWVFYNQFGTPAMHSDHSFRSEAEAVAAVAAAQKAIAVAPIKGP